MPSLREIANLIDAEIRGDENQDIAGISTLANATENQISFLSNRIYLKDLSQTRAAAVIIKQEDLVECQTAALIVKDPYLAFAKVSHLFAPDLGQSDGVHPKAIVDPSACIEEGAQIHAGAVIAARVYIGSRSVIEPNVVIGPDSHIGEETWVKSGVQIRHGISIGNRCVIHNGTVIGSDGFGFAPNNGAWVKVAQLGGVRIGDRVDIGANCTIDRGALDDTVIGNDVILDNLIQVAHNVTIGDGTAMAAGCAIAGSTQIGKRCIFGGMSGVAGHLCVGDDVHVTAMTMVIKDLDGPGVYSSGTGVMPNGQWKKSIARLRRLEQSEQRLKKVEQFIKKDLSE